MTLKPTQMTEIPEQTVKAAQASFPKGNVNIKMRDELGRIYDDEMFTEMYSHEGQPGWSAWRLALVTVMQFGEDLSDRQAADAVRGRIDWKYALSLELDDPGFDYSILSEFRGRLVKNKKGQEMLDKLLKMFKEKGWIKSRGKQRTDSTHMLASVRELHQIEVVGETMRNALNVLATAAPEWLKQKAKKEWVERYCDRYDGYHLPKEIEKRTELLITIGQDGQYLLEKVEESDEDHWMVEIPAIKTLKLVWEQQYKVEGGVIKHREMAEMPPPGQWVRSPYDPEARYGKKREIEWVGYKVHLTETCDEDGPHIITQVETRPAIEQDNQVTSKIQEKLVEEELVPEKHLVDAGYISAKLIQESQEKYQIDLIGPVHVDPSWQSHTPGAFDTSCFEINWEEKTAICPQKYKSVSWKLGKDSQKEPVIYIRFQAKTCQQCSCHLQCSHAKKSGRSLVLRAEGRHQILEIARKRQQTQEFKDLYKIRSGIEGTLSQAIRTSGLRQTRYTGMEKTHLQNIFTAIATNIKRLVNWLDEIPFATTRQAHFALVLAYA
jgi:transposase